MLPMRFAILLSLFFNFSLKATSLEPITQYNLESFDIEWDSQIISVSRGSEFIVKNPYEALSDGVARVFFSDRDLRVEQELEVEVSFQDIARSITQNIPGTFEALSLESQEEVTFEDGGHFIFLGSFQDGESQEDILSLIRVDEQGRAINDDEDIVSYHDAEIFHVPLSLFNQHIVRESLDNANFRIRSSLEHPVTDPCDGISDEECSQTLVSRSPRPRPAPENRSSLLAPRTSPIPKPRPEDLETSIPTDFPGLHSSFFDLGARHCVNFIQNNGELGDWGEIINEYVSDESNREIFFNDNIPQMSEGANVCPNWSRFTDEQKTHFWAWVFAAIAWDESKCRSGERNLRGSNTVAVGLLQMEEPRLERRWRPGVHCKVESVAAPRANILCGLDIMRELLRGPDGEHKSSGAIFSNTRTTSYWEKLISPGGGTIGARILTYDPCRN